MKMRYIEVFTHCYITHYSDIYKGAFRDRNCKIDLLFSAGAEKFDVDSFLNEHKTEIMPINSDCVLVKEYEIVFNEILPDGSITLCENNIISDINIYIINSENDIIITVKNGKEGLRRCRWLNRHRRGEYLLVYDEKYL